jgi:hypothetical protein
VGFEILTAVVLKSSIFWDIIPCSPLNVNQHFRGTCYLRLQCRRENHAKLCLPRAFTVVYCLAYSSTLKMKERCPSETSGDFQGVHVVIPQKTELFIVNLCIHAHHTKLPYAEYDKWRNRGSRERTSNPHSARGLKRQSFSLVFGRQPV